MSSAVLPSIVGLGLEINREPLWDTILQTNISGREVRLAQTQYPRWRWDITFNFLRSAAAFTELQQLAGFFNSRQGMFDSFLYQDADDNAVTGQAIGTGDGTTKTFQLVRAFGGFVEPILAPNVVSHVKNNGTDSGGWTVSNWGTATPGVITYGTAPAAGHAITADFSYYWPVRMQTDSVQFSQFLPGFYGLKKYSFISVKN